jgi:hypothetical protein
MEPFPNSFNGGLIRWRRRAAMGETARRFATLSWAGNVRLHARYPLEHREQQNLLVKLDTGGRS